MEDIAADLITLKYDVERRRTTAERLDRVRQALAAERKRVLGLEEQLRFEKGDVERLEGMSLASFITTLRGIREERLEKEREEYVAARLRYDGSVQAVAALEAQAAELDAELAALADADARYEASLAAREQQLLADAAPGRQPLRAMADELGTLRAALRELGEAEAAATAAGQGLENVSALLKKAEDWGTYDTWFGGGMIATSIKHDRIAQASAAAAQARQALQHLHAEVAEAGLSAAGLDVELGEFSATADFWLDGWFADQHVQKRIEEAQQRVRQAISGVQRVRDRVRAETARARERVDALEQQRRAHLEKT